MAVPKRRTSNSRKNKRRAHDAARMPARASCPQCGSVKLPHRVCQECGTYRGTTRLQIPDEE